MLSEVAFEQINANYWYGAYGPFRVVMMKDTGYINATKMCTSGGKEYREWARLKGSTELIQSLENQMVLENTQANSNISDFTLEDYRPENSPIGNLAMQKVNTGNKTMTDCVISGTYCHPDA